MEGLIKFFNLLKQPKNLVLFWLISLIIYIVGRYHSFDFIEWGSFKLSFDFLLFVSLVCVATSSCIILGKICEKIWNKTNSLFILKKLKDCSNDEKDFLYNRVYENGNKLDIDMHSDGYFFKRDENAIGYRVYLYKKRFNSRKKVGVFLRKLENKGILKNGGTYNMIIPEKVWNVLVKNSKQIFEDK